MAAPGSSNDIYADTLAVFDQTTRPQEPQTTTEVADALDIPRRTAYKRLETLVERGDVCTKKVGASARVWWRSDSPTTDGPSAPTDEPSTAAESLVDVLDTAEVGVFVLDEEFEVAWINDATERYFGLDREQVVGRDKRALVEESIAATVEDSTAFADTVLATYDDNTYTEQFECRVTEGDGRTDRWLQHRSQPIESGRYAGGRVELYYDVSDQKRSEQSLHETERRFRSLVDAVDEYAIFMLDPDGHVQNWNSGAERLKGYSEDEIVGEHISTFYTDEDRDAGVPEKNLATATERGSFSDEGWRVRKDGSRFFANVTVTAIRDDEGALQGYAKVTRDMTEQREREQQLRRERNLTEQLLETAPIRLAVFRPDGSVERVNSKARRDLGIDDGDLAEFSLEDFDLYDADGDPIPSPEHPVSVVVETGDSLSERLVQHDTSDGRRRWASLNASPLFDDDELERVVVAGKDVTELKRHARELSRQHDQLKNELNDVFTRITDGMFAVDDEWRVTYVNEQAERLVGVDESKLLGADFWEQFPGRVGGEAWERYQEAMETQTPVTFETHSPVVDGWVEIRAYPSETGLSIYFQDITERKAREQQLERYEQLVETVWDGVYALDEDDRFVLVNDAFCNLVGYEREELIGEHPTLINSETVNESANELESQIAAGERDFGVLEYQLERSDGEVVPVETKFGPIEYGDGRTGRCGVTRDVTERKQFEETLTALYDSSRALLSAETKGGVSRSVVETVTDVLDFSGVVTYLYDEEEGLLAPNARSIDADFMREELPAVPPDDSSITGHAYATSEPHRFDDVTESPYLQTNATEMRAGIFAPMGAHGVLIVGAKAVGEFDERTQQLVELLAANAQAAYDRVEREQELETQNERLDGFASMLAHELRNPVTIGQIYSQQLPAEEAAEAVEYVAEAFDRIEDMIQVMLMLARGGEAISEETTVQLADAARAAWDEADTASATLEIELEAEVQADETYVRHLFRNLFENAVEHGSTSPRSQAHEDAVEHGSTSNRPSDDDVHQTSSDAAHQNPSDSEDAVEHGGRAVTVTVGDLPTGFYVADDGVGIPDDERDAVFETGHTTASGEGGTGLGLAFVQELADVYGWTCTATESESGGAQFEFTNVASTENVGG